MECPKFGVKIYLTETSTSACSHELSAIEIRIIISIKSQIMAKEPGYFVNGISNCLQIFRQVKSKISGWRGIDVCFRFLGL